LALCWCDLTVDHLAGQLGSAPKVNLVANSIVAFARRVLNLVGAAIDMQVLRESIGVIRVGCRRQ
jgi:hypothetical protein